MAKRGGGRGRTSNVWRPGERNSWHAFWEVVEAREADEARQAASRDVRKAARAAKKLAAAVAGVKAHPPGFRGVVGQPGAKTGHRKRRHLPDFDWHKKSPGAFPPSWRRRQAPQPAGVTVYARHYARVGIGDVDGSQATDRPVVTAACGDPRVKAFTLDPRGVQCGRCRLILVKEGKL